MMEIKEEIHLEELRIIKAENSTKKKEHKENIKFFNKIY